MTHSEPSRYRYTKDKYVQAKTFNQHTSFLELKEAKHPELKALFD
jgi:hypothetical protein